MESVNFTNDFDIIEYDDRLESEALVGWSSTCLDQTISYYVDYNYNEISNEESINN